MDGSFKSSGDPKLARRSPLRVVLTIAALLLAGGGALLGGLSVAQHRAPWDILTHPLAPQPQELFHKDHILVLLVGLDYDWTNNDEEFSSQSRSDVIKAIDLDFVTHNVYVLDVPRDMEATLPGGEVAKINQAQSDGGIRESQAVIAKWLGIPGFDRYVILRINTTKDLINAIGGIDIDPMNSDAILGEGPNGPINYDDNWGHLHIHFKPGMQHLDGAQAVAYARFRHDWCSDPCRIKRQDQVIAAIVKKLRGNKLNTFLHIKDLIGVFNRDVQTNLTQAEELSLALAFADIPKGGLHTKQVPYVADQVLPYAGDVLIPDQAKKAELVRTMLLDPPVPTPAPDPNAIAAIAPSSLRVDVENGTQVPGAAKRVAALLHAKGFRIGVVGDAARSDVAKTTLREHSPTAFAAYRVREALGAAASKARVVDAQPSAARGSASASDVTVIIGADLANAFAQSAAQ